MTHRHETDMPPKCPHVRCYRDELIQRRRNPRADFKGFWGFSTCERVER
jgi:hypothetical protein